MILNETCALWSLVYPQLSIARAQTHQLFLYNQKFTEFLWFWNSMGPQQLLCYFYHVNVRYARSRSQSHHFMSDVSQPIGVGVFYFFLFFNIKCCISSSILCHSIWYLYTFNCVPFSVWSYIPPPLCINALYNCMCMYFFNWCGHVVLHLSVLRKLYYFSFSLFYVYH